MSEKKIAVSVISPIYNTPEKMLRNNIEHLISQTLKNIEIILVDDGSNTETANICDEYAKKDDRIIVIHQKNKGLCGARNSGQKEAKGEYISFVDGDDFLEEDALEFLYKNCQDAEIVMSCLVKDYGDHIKQYDYSKFEDKTIYGEEQRGFLQAKVLDFTANISHTGGKLYKKSFLDDNDLRHREELRQGAEGLEFLIRIFGHTNTVLYLEKNTYHYSYNDNSITTVHDERNHEKVIGCFEAIEKNIKELANYNILHEALLVRLQYVIVTTAVSGYFSRTNKDNYLKAKKNFRTFLNKHALLMQALRMSTKRLDPRRAVILKLLRYRLYLLVFVMVRILRNHKREK